MSIFASPADAAELRSILEDAMEAVLYEREPATVDELEHRALRVMPFLLHPATPVEHARMLTRLLEECADETAIGAMGVYARLASGPLGDAARDALPRMALGRMHSPFEDSIGTLGVRRARRHDVGDGSVIFTLALARAGVPHGAQPAIVALGPDERGHVIVEHMEVGSVNPVDAVDERVENFPDAVSEDVDPGTVAADLAEALGHMVEHDHGLYYERIVDLALLEGALIGDPGVLPRPLLLPPDHPDHIQAAFMKRLVVEMLADGVDPSDDEQRSAWLERRRLEVLDGIRREKRRERRRERRRKRRRAR